jgi:probable HAF family extracellular repeat protein
MTGDWGYRPRHAFLWDQVNGMQDLGYLPGHDSSAEAYGINDQGQVVGVSRAAPPQANGHAFVWQDGTMTDVGNQGGGLESHAFGIDPSGLVVGDASFSDMFTAPPHAFALRFTQPLGPMRNLSRFLGNPPPPASSRVYGLNASGYRVGTYGSHDPGRGFVLDPDNALVTLPPFAPGGDQYSVAYAINASAQVVGASGVSSPPPFLGVHGFLWDRDTGMHILTNLVTDVRWAVTSANAINDDGIIVGQGRYSGGNARAIEVTFDTTPAVPGQPSPQSIIDPLSAQLVTWRAPVASADSETDVPAEPLERPEDPMSAADSRFPALAPCRSVETPPTQLTPAEATDTFIACDGIPVRAIWEEEASRFSSS